MSDHNQICRIVEMTGNLPEFMLENGKDTLKFFKRVRSVYFGERAFALWTLCGTGTAVELVAV